MLLWIFTAVDPLLPECGCSDDRSDPAERGLPKRCPLRDVPHPETARATARTAVPETKR